MVQDHSVKIRPHRIGNVVKVFKTNEPLFSACKGVKKTSFSAVSRDILWFARYLGITITASLPLPHHRSVIAIATVTAFLHYQDNAHHKNQCSSQHFIEIVCRMLSSIQIFKKLIFFQFFCFSLRSFLLKNKPADGKIFIRKLGKVLKYLKAFIHLSLHAGIDIELIEGDHCSVRTHHTSLLTWQEKQDLAERIMVTRLHLYGKWIKVRFLLLICVTFEFWHTRRGFSWCD